MCLGRPRKILLIALWRPNQRDKTGFKRDGPIAGIRLESKSWRTFMVLIPCICQALSLLRPSANRASLTFILLNCHLLQEGFPSHQAPPSQHMLHLLHVLGHNGNYWISFSVYLNISLSLCSLCGWFLCQKLHGAGIFYPQSPAQCLAQSRCSI